MPLQLFLSLGHKNKNRTIALEWTAAKATVGGGLNAFYWRQLIFALDAVLVKLLTCMDAS